MAHVELRQNYWLTTPMGEARALFLIDYGPEDDLLWLCVQQEEPHVGEFRTWHNSQVRMLANETFLRPAPVSMRADSRSSSPRSSDDERVSSDDRNWRHTQSSSALERAILERIHARDEQQPSQGRAPRAESETSYAQEKARVPVSRKSPPKHRIRKKRASGTRQDAR